MYKDDINRYMCPTKLYPYLRSILVRCWYDCNFFPDSYEEGLTEMNSSIPEDIYVKILKEAKSNYLADTNDSTYDHYEEKKYKIDHYTYNNYSLKDSSKYIYTCPMVLMNYVKDILMRCYYSFEFIESIDEKYISFKSNLSEDALEFVIERAKMELLSSHRNDCLYVSPKEDGNRNGWLTYMMKDVWHTYFYFMPSNDDLKELEEEIYGI